MCVPSAFNKFWVDFEEASFSAKSNEGLLCISLCFQWDLPLQSETRNYTFVNLQVFLVKGVCIPARFKQSSENMEVKL